jgi:hypothetical protein
MKRGGAETVSVGGTSGVPVSAPVGRIAERGSVMCPILSLYVVFQFWVFNLDHEEV